MYPSERSASRAVNSAAPQLIIISRPSGSATISCRPASARRLICRPPAVNRHGWVLCTDGAHTAAVTMYLATSPAASGPVPAGCPSGRGATPLAPPGPRRALIAHAVKLTPAAAAVQDRRPTRRGTFARPSYCQQR